MNTQKIIDNILGKKRKKVKQDKLTYQEKLNFIVNKVKKMKIPYLTFENSYGDYTKEETIKKGKNIPYNYTDDINNHLKKYEFYYKVQDIIDENFEWNGNSLYVQQQFSIFSVLEKAGKIKII